MPQEARGDGGLLKRLDDAVGRAVSSAASRLISGLLGRNREQRALVQSPDSEESATLEAPDTRRPDLDALSILKEAPDDPVEPEAPAADANSVLHRLAAGGRLSPVGTALCQRLIEENRGYQPDSVLEAAISEGQFSPEDLAKIAVFLVSVYYEPGADTSANESLARNLFEGLAERGVVTQELVKLCVQAMADAPCVSLTHPVQEYLKKAGGMVGEYRAMVIAAFNWDNYSAYCRKQPAAEEKRAPPAGVPAERTLDYFLLRRSWLKGRESPGPVEGQTHLVQAQKNAAMHRLQPSRTSGRARPTITLMAQSR